VFVEEKSNFIPLWVCSIGNRCSVRVANELGAGSAKRAKFAIVNVVLTSLTIGCVLFVLFLLFRGRIGYVFTNSSKVIRAIADLSPLLAFSILLNSVQPVLSGASVSINDCSF